MYLRKDLAYKFVNEFVDDRGCVISTITTYMTLLTCGKIVLTEKCDTYDYDMGSWDVDAQNYIPWHECEYKSEIDGKNFFGADAKLHFEMCVKHFDKTAFRMDEPILSSYGAYEPADDNIVNEYSLKQACLEQLQGIQKQIRSLNMFIFSHRDDFTYEL